MGERLFLMGINTGRPKSESITFRLVSQVLDKLRKKANHDKVTVNTLVNQLVADYFDWGMTAVDAGWMVTPKTTVSKALEMLSQDEIRSLADAAYQETKDMFIFMKGKDDEQSFLSLLRIIAEKSGCRLRELEKDGKPTFIIQHDLGRNYSLFSKSLYETIMHKYGVQVEFETTDHTLIMSLLSSFVFSLFTLQHGYEIAWPVVRALSFA